MASSSEPTWSKDYRDKKDVPYWLENIDDKITPEIFNLLVTYSQIPPANVKQHIYDTREKAWAIRSYPCTGLAAWLQPKLQLNTAYPSIIDRLKSGGTFMDIGCFIGHDLRQLTFDGAPKENLYGIDIVSHWDIGYSFFNDRERFKAHFIETDMMNPTSELQALYGKMDVINAMHVLHQWDWEGQVKGAMRLVELSSGPDALIVGEQVGSVGANTPENDTMIRLGTKHIFWHSVDTWRRMWNEVEERTGTKWICETTMHHWKKTATKESNESYMGPDVRLLRFVVKRVA